MGRKKDFDDEIPKGKGGGTMSLDVSKMELDDEPPPRSGGRGASLGRRSALADDDDDLTGGRRGRRKRGGRSPAKKAAGFGTGGGTQALDVRGLELDDDPPPAGGRRGGWARGAGKGRAARALDDDDLELPTSRKKRRGMAGSRRCAEPELLAPEDQVESGFHDWGRGGSPAPGGAEPGVAAAETEDQAPAHLMVREPGKPVRRYPLSLKSRSHIVGREIGCDIVLEDIKASRQHFEISYLAGVFTLKDLGSGNGTRVDGHKVERIQLVDGMVIGVGDCELQFKLDQEALDSLQARDARGGKRSRGAVEDEDEDEDEEEDDEPQRVLSGVAILLMLLTMMSLLLLAGTFVAWLVFKPESKKPAGSQVVELEEIPKEDPRLRRAEQHSAKAILGEAEDLDAQGRAWDALRLARVALLVDPGLSDARSMVAQLEGNLQRCDSEACEMKVWPSRPRRGRKMKIFVGLNGPISRISGTFLDTPLTFSPQGDEEGTWTSVVELPRRAPAGTHNLELTIFDTLEEPVDLRSELHVR